MCRSYKPSIMSEKRGSVPTMGEIDKLIDRKLRSSWGRQTPKREVESAGRLHLVQLMSRHSEKALDWDEVTKLSQSHASEVTETDLRGRTCLSLACAKDPPATAVRMLLRACRFGTEASRDKTGNTALHIAIQHNASLEVIGELCTSHRLVKTMDHRGSTPLHAACKNTYCNDGRTDDLVQCLMEAYPEALHQSDDYGRTPLQVALESNASSKIVEMLQKEVESDCSSS